MSDDMKIPTNWTFKSEEVANHFDRHVQEQLPWYLLATKMTCQLARSYLQEDTTLVDLACSTGNITRELRQTIKERNIRAWSLDNSEEMRERFIGEGEIQIGDLLDLESIPDFDVCVIMLGLMFTSISERENYLRKLKKKLKKGGAIIIVDKITPMAGYLGQSITRLTLKNKLDSGVNPSDIIEKELSLSGVQRPTELRYFTQAGYKQWLQIGDFSGFIFEEESW